MSVLIGMTSVGTPRFDLRGILFNFHREGDNALSLIFPTEILKPYSNVIRFKEAEHDGSRDRETSSNQRLRFGGFHFFNLLY